MAAPRKVQGLARGAAEALLPIEGVLAAFVMTFHFQEGRGIYVDFSLRTRGEALPPDLGLMLKGCGEAMIKAGSDFLTSQMAQIDPDAKPTVVHDSERDRAVHERIASEDAEDIMKGLGLRSPSEPVKMPIPGDGVKR